MSAEHNIHKFELTTLDTARGDDFIAILAQLGLRNRVTDVQDVLIATYGNRDARTSALNTNFVVSLASELQTQPSPVKPQVMLGADRPLRKRNPYTLSPDAIEYAIHGDFGFDFANSKADIPLSQHAYREISASERDVSILSLAATTELPKALRALHKRNNIRTLTIMGGTLKRQGNVAPFTEANFNHDPKATLETLSLCEEYGIPTLLVPLDTTEQEDVLFTPDRLDWLRERLHNSPRIMHIIDEVAGPEGTYGGFYLGRTKQDEEFPYKNIGYSGVPVHDLTAAMAKYDFENGGNIFRFEQVPVSLNNLGEIGVARPYMDPFEIIVAGPIIDYNAFWELIAYSFEQYQ